MRRRVRQVLAGRQAHWLVALVVTLAMGLPVLRAHPATAAGPPFAASGTFAQTSFVQSNIRSAGGVTLFDFTEHDTLTGTFVGTTILHGSCVVRASGQAVCQAVETFTGTVAGRAGTVQFRDVIFVDLTTGAAHGSFTIVGGTGGLATLHGHGTFQGVGGSGTYTGLLVFAP
jgi:hypothetical protein